MSDEEMRRLGRDPVCICGHGASLHAAAGQHGSISPTPCAGCKARLAAGDLRRPTCERFEER